MTLDERAARGVRAQRLLDDEMLAEAFAKLEQEYVTQWRNTEFRDQDARERLWWAARVVAKVREHLLIVAKNGEIAEREVRAIAGRKRMIFRDRHLDHAAVRWRRNRSHIRWREQMARGRHQEAPYCPALHERKRSDIYACCGCLGDPRADGRGRRGRRRAGNK